ncbi:hypothetical protein GJ496_008393 [Pomphorhynchus laevis]|nr:hypothetical protein GJ496_008393 [Pomphorhynchus laevis]
MGTCALVDSRERNEVRGSMSEGRQVTIQLKTRCTKLKTGLSLEPHISENESISKNCSGKLIEFDSDLGMETSDTQESDEEQHISTALRHVIFRVKLYVHSCKGFFSPIRHAELLVDNGKIFRSRQLKIMSMNWDVSIIFRAAYRLKGNVELNETIVRLREQQSNAVVHPIEATFRWSDFQVFLKAPKKNKFVSGRSLISGYQLGQEVWVKPVEARCTSSWNKGLVTEILSEITVGVNGVPKHVNDIRYVVEPHFNENESISKAVREN